MQAYSLGLGVVCISTFRKGYMLASYRENIGKAHNYQKLAVCTACTLTSIPITNMCMKI